jgi:hypothetical protein
MFFVVRECLTESVDPTCLTNRTINRGLGSAFNQTGCLSKSGKECVPGIWKDIKGRWFQVG